MAYILHIDTSADTGLTALAKDGAVLGIVENADTRNHAAVINTNIEQLLAEHDITLQDLDCIAVCGGPGSYTGLRIGLATAKGFCYALDKPLMMHNKLLLLATRYAYSEEGFDAFVSILQARAGEYFAAVYNADLLEIKEPQHVLEDDMVTFAAGIPDNFMVSGYMDEITEVAFKRSALSSDSVHIDIYNWAKYAFDKYNCNEFVNLANVEPFYLKQVYTHKPKNIN